MRSTPAIKVENSASAPANTLSQSVTTIPLTSVDGIGKARAALLGKLKLQTVEDALLYRPRRYENRANLLTIAELMIDESAAVSGVIVECGVKYWRQRRSSVFECVVEDSTGRLHCRWWNMPFLKRMYQKGQKLFIHGKMKQLKPRTMDHPETEFLTGENHEDARIHMNRIVPIYGLTEGLQQRWLRELIFHLLESHGKIIHEPHPHIMKQHRLSFHEAVHLLHAPDSMKDIESARERLALEEAIEIQEQVQFRRKRFMETMRAAPCQHDNRFIKPMLQNLPFDLTKEQIRVMSELRADLSRKHPMRRLLQGDVGSGKTLIATLAALMVLESGFDVLLMAPTTLLAEQHHRTISRWFQPFPINVQLHTSTSKPVNEGNLPCIMIGTHALIHSGGKDANIGMVIVDEQHKFGVAQREKLLKKGHSPHLLIMTATPIPRTLGLTLYGDLDVSVLRGLPKGRGPLKTYLRTPEARDKVLDFVKKELSKGRQAYFVYPRVEEKQQPGIKAVTRESQALRSFFEPYEVEVLHGRMKAETSEAIMTRFTQGTLHVLLATTVIEVGVDVPNATVMVVENAEQFGLAQLHQIRGRIGRGSHDSHCILLGDATQKDAWERLKVLEETRDGFEIAEADFKARGPGELAGKQQSGLPDWHFLDLHKDQSLLDQARTAVRSSMGLPTSTV
ncbi:MAG: ATP-dependent DNA helicase RecG [Verrucomicrobiota bacterium]|jgi:ATP-dependent DNA helicase RecG